MPASAIHADVETIVCAILNNFAGFAASGITAKKYDEDARVGKDRVTVKAKPANALAIGKDGATVKVWSVDLEIEAMLATRSRATMEAVAKGIDDALASPTTAGVIATATSLFPNGIESKAPSDLTRESEKRETRLWSRMITFWVRR